MNNEKKIIELKNLVEAAELSLQRARKILVELVGSQEEKMLLEQAKKAVNKSNKSEEAGGMVIEGVFDGQNMVGADGKKYSVPANYASKSKLVEGDGLKLTILQDGTFVYKQIKPLERKRLIGELIVDEESGEYRVVANNKAYKVLNASITYFKGEPGDRVTLLVPKDKESSWAAVENLFKPGQEGYVENIDEENARLEAQAAAEKDNASRQASGEQTAAENNFSESNITDSAQSDETNQTASEEAEEKEISLEDLKREAVPAQQAVNEAEDEFAKTTAEGQNQVSEGIFSPDALSDKPEETPAVPVTGQDDADDISSQGVNAQNNEFLAENGTESGESSPVYNESVENGGSEADKVSDNGFSPVTHMENKGEGMESADNSDDLSLSGDKANNGGLEDF